MNDLVRPSALFSGARVSTAGPSGVLGTMPNPPPQVSQLPAGSTLAGVVVGHDAEGHTLVRTDLGTLSVATKAQLPVNSEVTLQIRSSGGQLHVLIMHSEPPPGGVKGAPPPPPASAPTGGAGPQSQAGGAGPQGQATTAPGGGHAAITANGGHAVPAGHGPASDLLTLGQILRAIVQSPAPAAPTGAGAGGIPGETGGAGQPPAAQALATIAARLAPGSELQLRIISVQTPGVQAHGGQSPGPQAPGTIAPGGQGGTPGIAGGGAASGATQGGVGQAGSPTTPATAGATPNGPIPADATRQAAGPAVPAGHGTAPGATTSGITTPGKTTPGAPIPAASSQSAPTPGAQASAASGRLPVSGVPALGAIARYTAAGGTSAAATQGTSLGAATNPAAPLAAPGTGESRGLGSGHGGADPTAPASAARLTALPGSGIASGPGAGPAPVAPATGPAPAPGSAPAPGAAAGAVQFTGTVTAITHAGQPVLQTPLGTLTLEIRTPLQVGSRITFELPSVTLAPGDPGGSSPRPAALGTLAHSWPALIETLQVLQEAAPPGAAAAAVPEAIPQPGSRLASNLLFFLSALSGGDVTRWLGNQASQVLKGAGRDSLLSRLGQDFGQLGRLADNQGGDWRLLLIPLYDGDQLHQLRLFLRHGPQERDGDGVQDDEDQTRFVVEVEISRLGDLQLDGLVRDKRLDLILRSRAPLPDFMRRDIVKIFHDGNEITGYQGNIGFQSSFEWKAMPIQASEAAAGVVV